MTIGLTSQEAQHLLETHGANKLPEPKPLSVAVTFARQFKSPFIYVLLAAGVVSYFLGHSVNSFFIILVLFLNALIGTIQEYSAAKAAEALKSMVPYYASVFRDGEIVRLPTEELVPGDVIQLVSGDKVPADIKLHQVNNLIVDESMLTGESAPQEKGLFENQTESAELPITERKDRLFAGTIITRGRGEGVVHETGIDTEIGHIASDVTSTENIKPPLLVRMEKFTLGITYAILILIAILFLITLVRGDDLANAFLLGVALAVSAIPEGLPAAITVALAIGMRRMAKKGVIVRKLLAVESLGSCTYIASDKTGTLTVNEMTIRKILLPNGTNYDVTGEGLDFHGEIVDQQGQIVTPSSALDALILAGTLANEAKLEVNKEKIKGQGDHVDLAFLVLCNKSGKEQDVLRLSHKELANIPYESENAYSASVNNTPEGPHLFVKGSVEQVLHFATNGFDGTNIDKQTVLEQMQALAKQGYRVMGLASKPLDAGSQLAPMGQLNNMQFLGIVGMQDPLRFEAKAAVNHCHQAEIKVAMVTGDHQSTANAIAQDLGLTTDNLTPLTGVEISNLWKTNPDDFQNQIKERRVFARVEPRQKKLLVDNLIANGEFVAVTGDGVNDAPALHAAHVGVAMGKRGTDVAKESADLIITDDNFSSIVEGVKQGRMVYNNIRKVIFLLISTGAAEITLFVLSLLSGLPLPLMPIQLLWLNLVTNGLQDVALAFEPEEGNELKQAPRKPNEPVFDRYMIERVMVNALVMGCLAFVVFKIQIEAGMSVEAARNMTLMQMVLFENIHVFNCRSETRSIFKQAFFGNPFLLIGMLSAQALHIIAMYTPGLNSVLEVQPVSLEQWLQLLLIASSLLAADEIFKWIKRNRKISGSGFSI